VVDSVPPDGARLVPYPVYEDGRLVFLQSLGFDRVDDEMRAARALSLVGNMPYDLLTANCEHVATYAETGVPESRQVSVVLGFAMAGLLIWALH